MGFFERLFSRSRGSAHIAEQRLRFVLAYERALIARERNPEAAVLEIPERTRESVSRESIQRAPLPPRRPLPMPTSPPESPPEFLAARTPPVSLPKAPRTAEPPPPRARVITQPAPLTPSRRNTSPRDQVLLIRHSILPGQIVHHNGTIMIYGDVHSAAQVISDGDVIVFGRLRGVVHAGAAGDTNAIIAALFFMPTQARIARCVMSSWQTNRRQPHSAEQALVRGNEIVIEGWDPKSN